MDEIAIPSSQTMSAEIATNNQTATRESIELNLEVHVGLGYGRMKQMELSSSIPDAGSEAPHYGAPRFGGKRLIKQNI